MVKRSPWIERARSLVPAQWVRDARMVLDGLAGRSPPPFYSTAPSARPASPRVAAPTARAEGIPPLVSDAGGDVAVTMLVGGRRYEVVNRAHETVLESALGQQVPAPYSCTMGGCGSCRMKLREGAVTLEEPNCLSAEERAQGYVLTCIGRATRPCVLEADPS